MRWIGSLALAATLALNGCAGQAGPTSGPVARPGTVAIEVTNHNWMDVVVYAVGAWSRVRLGSVETGAERRFVVGPSVNTITGQFYLEAHPVGSTEVFRSQPMLVAPGDEVLWSVENELLLSSFRVISRA